MQFVYRPERSIDEITESGNYTVEITLFINTPYTNIKSIRDFTVE